MIFMSVSSAHSTDPDRISGWAPGIIFHDSYGGKFVTVWDSKAIELSPTAEYAVTYADQDTDLIIEHQPRNLPVPLVVSDNFEAAVAAMPVGTLFTEFEANGWTHSYVKLSHGRVMLHNGDPRATPYTLPINGTVTHLHITGISHFVKPQDGELFSIFDLITSRVGVGV
jgi:hypothetical protein